MPENKKTTFILSDETLNLYGFWVKTSGIDLVQFRKNPVMLYDHERYGQMPIGKWTDIRIEDGKLLASPEFDANDELALKIQSKVENGYLNGASIGFKPLLLSDKKEDLINGQTRPTVLKSEIVEVSITPFPANKNSLKLQNQNGELVKLSANELNTLIPILRNMKQITVKLGLPDGATEEQILSEIANLLSSKENAQKQRNEMFIQLGTKNGTVTDKNKDKMLKLADADFELALDIIDKEPQTEPKADTKTNDSDVRLSEVLKNLGNAKTVTSKSFRELANDEPQTLEKLFTEDFDQFNKLYKAEYGHDYK